MWMDVDKNGPPENLRSEGQSIYFKQLDTELIRLQMDSDFLFWSKSFKKTNPIIK